MVWFWRRPKPGVICADCTYYQGSRRCGAHPTTGQRDYVTGRWLPDDRGETFELCERFNANGECPDYWRRPFWMMLQGDGNCEDGGDAA